MAWGCATTATTSSSFSTMWRENTKRPLPVEMKTIRIMLEILLVTKWMLQIWIWDGDKFEQNLFTVYSKKVSQIYQLLQTNVVANMIFCYCSVVNIVFLLLFSISCWRGCRQVGLWTAASPQKRRRYHQVSCAIECWTFKIYLSQQKICLKLSRVLILSFPQSAIP